MKRCLCCALALLLLLSSWARAEETGAEPALYTAITVKKTALSAEPRNGKNNGTIRFDAKVEVLEYGEKWCRVRYRSRTGYVRTRLLWGFVSMDPLHYPSPQFTACSGYVRLARETLIKGGKFSGLSAGAGTVIAVYDEALSLPVWRGTAQLDAGAGDYTPFAHWESAAPGDAIAGFTTYYNENTGKPLQASRQHNIQLGCERINSQTVAPGAEFSFNALCAPYSLANGYEVAKNISKSGKGPGGGVCQVSTTLYNAVLGLPLLITEWAAHRSTGVNYIPRSFDAAVGSTTDLRFRNDLPYPLRIEALPQDGAVTVLIYRAEQTEEAGAKAN